jgi:transposase-like protein
MVRRRRDRGPSVLLCPQCGSDKIIYDAALITGQRYHCLACDYVGSLVLEKDLERPLDDDDE